MNVMISYSHKDQEYANTVVSMLEEKEITCWIDYRDATPGINYAGSIVQAIKNADYVVLILSSNSLQSPQVLNEVNAAVNNNVTIIPMKIDAAPLNDSFEYYLGKTHWLNAVVPPFSDHVDRLIELIKGTASLPVPQPVKISTDQVGCKMVKLGELLEMGYTATKIAMQLVENDYINCNGIGLSNEGTADQWAETLQSNSDTFQYLINEKGIIVGDWSIVALTDEAYDEAIDGRLLEADIDENNTELISLPDFYNGYILSLSLLPQYRTAENYNLLINSFFLQIQTFSELGVYFKRWCMNVFGKEVTGLVKKLGFQYKCDNVEFGKIFACDFIPLPNLPLLKKFPKLVENYANM